MQNRWLSFSFFVIGSCLSILAGCQRGPSLPSTVPVTGTVTYNGEPLTEANVVLVNRDPKQRSATGTTDELGNFQLKTYFDPTHDLDGVVAGEYLITVTKREKKEDISDAASDSVQKTPEEMAKLQEERTRRQVMVFAKPRKSLIPIRYTKPERSGLVATVTAGMEPLTLQLKD